jgi:hypothetical protein
MSNCVVVLFALICSRGYKWTREGAPSQVSVVCRSHVWLKVEEEERVLPEEGKGRIPKAPPPLKSTCFPFIRQGE